MCVSLYLLIQQIARIFGFEDCAYILSIIRCRPLHPPHSNWYAYCLMLLIPFNSVVARHYMRCHNIYRNGIKHNNIRCSSSQVCPLCCAATLYTQTLFSFKQGSQTDVYPNYSPYLRSIDNPFGLASKMGGSAAPSMQCQQVANVPMQSVYFMSVVVPD